MVYEILRFPVYGLLVAVLVYNLTQRKHLEHGERKRFASLKFAGLILLFAVEVFLIRRLELSRALAIVAVGVALVSVLALGYALRSSFAVYRRSCTSCARWLPLSRVLYYDDNLCLLCAESHQTLAAAGESATGFQNGVPKAVDDIYWSEWTPDTTAVLCFVLRGDDVMLIRKKTGLGAGKISGPGGRIEEGESAASAAIRETAEETLITPIDPEQRAELSFVFTNAYSLRVFAFFTPQFSGAERETDEAAPFWCNRNELPFERMWEDDKEWLPRALSGEHLNARFVFDGERMISKCIETIASPAPGSNDAG